MKRLASVLSLAVVLASSSFAEVVGFVPPHSYLSSPGNTATVAVIISGLPSATHVGAFDIDVGFDSSIIRLDQVAFGSSLGSPDFQTYIRSGGALLAANPGAGDAITSATLGGMDVDLAEVSLLLDLSSQPSDFTLASLTFTGLESGISRLDIVVNALGDQDGRALSTTATSADIQVAPEPGSLIFLGTCLGALAFRRRKSGQTRA